MLTRESDNVADKLSHLDRETTEGAGHGVDGDGSTVVVAESPGNIALHVHVSYMSIIASLLVISPSCQDWTYIVVLDVEDSDIVNTEVDVALNSSSDNGLAFTGDIIVVPLAQRVSSGREVVHEAINDIVQARLQSRLVDLSSGIVSKDSAEERQSRSNGSSSEMHSDRVENKVN